MKRQALERTYLDDETTVVVPACVLERRRAQKQAARDAARRCDATATTPKEPA